MTNKTYLVARREFVENLRTKTFWIGILAVPVLIVGASAVSIWMQLARPARQYAVVDRSGWFLQAIEQKADQEDLALVLRMAFELERSGAGGAGKLPQPVRDLAKLAASSLGSPVSVTDAVEGKAPQAGAGLEVLAAAIIQGGGVHRAELTNLLGAAHADQALALAEPIRAWWHGLTQKEAAALVPGRSLSRARFARVEVTDTSERGLEELNRKVAEDQLFGYFVLAADPVAATEPNRYVSRNLTDRDLYDWFRERATDVVREKRLAAKEIDPAVARWLQETSRFQSRQVGKEGQESAVKAEDLVRQWMPVAFVYLLWIAIFSIIQMLLTNTIEEKSNRILEVLLSSVSPLQLMSGKIVGITATGLTMIGSWLIFFVGAVLVTMSFIGDRLDFNLGSILADPLLLGSFVVYFVLGYLFFAAIIVGIGSVCNSLKESQNLMLPITMLMMVPLMSMIPISRDPNGTMAKVLSYIPPFTPFVMMNRAAGPPALWEYAVTTVLMVASVFGAFWAGAKIFRIGILMTGKAPRPLEILRWLKAPVTQVPARQGEGPG